MGPEEEVVGKGGEAMAEVGEALVTEAGGEVEATEVSSLFSFMYLIFLNTFLYN